MKQKSEWKRNCPKCGDEIPYKRIYERDKAEKRNTSCKSCAMTGIKCKSFTEEARKNISNSQKGKKRSKKTKKKISESLKGRTLTDEHRKNQRLSAIKRIEKQNGQIMPNSNPKATLIIRAKAKELGITDLRDAETPGGEFQVCGYFVDGHSKEKNIVIEYNEPFHKNQIERDTRRKQEIMKELGWIFIVIWE